MELAVCVWAEVSCRNGERETELGEGHSRYGWCGVRSGKGVVARVP